MTNQWHVLNGEQQKGPYTYKQMIEFMQKGELFDYHYIWSPGMESWTMLAEVADFSRDRLALLIQTHGPGSEGFTKRESQRVPVSIPLYAHNNENFFHGECTNLSINGALVTLSSPFVLPSQEIVLHFSESDFNPISFKAHAVVVRKNMSKQVLHVKSGLIYAIRFLNVQNTGMDQVKSIIDKHQHA